MPTWKVIARTAAIIIPLFFVFGFINGCARSSEEEFEKNALRVLSTAEVEDDRIVVDLWHVRPPLNLWTNLYEFKNSAGVHTDYHLPEPLTTRVGVDTFELALSAAYGKLIEDPETRKTNVLIRPIPTFVFTLSGYTMGYFIGASSGWGDDETRLNQLARDPQFREEVIDVFYQVIAFKIRRFLDLNPSVPNAKDDQVICDDFLRARKHEEKDWAVVHHVIINYIERPDFINMPPEQGVTPLGLIKSLGAASFGIWAFSVISLIRHQRRRPPRPQPPSEKMHEIHH